MTTHELKVWPEFYGPLHTGDKLFELRYDDRYYKVGDGLVLREFAPCRACHGKGQQPMLGAGMDPFA